METGFICTILVTSTTLVEAARVASLTVTATTTITG